MSLRDGTAKTVSDPRLLAHNMTDDAEAIDKKIRKARTDPAPLPDSPAGLEGRPEAANLIGIYAALSGATRDETIARFAGAQFSAFKKELADLAVAKLGPIGTEMKRLMAEPAHLDAILKKGGLRARAIAETTSPKSRTSPGCSGPSQIPERAPWPVCGAVRYRAANSPGKL
jgi:tryptophanyl-tRNA synthetase